MYHLGTRNPVSNLQLSAAALTRTFWVPLPCARGHAQLPPSSAAEQARSAKLADEVQAASAVVAVTCTFICLSHCICVLSCGTAVHNDDVTRTCGPGELEQGQNFLYTRHPALLKHHSKLDSIQCAAIAPHEHSEPAVN